MAKKCNCVPQLESLTISEFEDILYALEERRKTPGLSGDVYDKLRSKLQKMQDGTPIDRIKGNPVPSLDKFIKQFNEENKEDWSCLPQDYLELFGEWFKKQNGVETDKEQPDLSKYLKVLKMDKQLIPNFIKIHKELLLFCKEYDLILDLASSDVCIFLEDKHGGSIGLG